MSSRRHVLFLLLLLAVNVNSIEFAETELGPTLLVLCTKEFIRINVLLNYYNFFGVIYTRPNRKTCSVQGVGEKDVTLFIPLEDPGRTDCGVALQDDYYSVVVDIRKHHIVELATDTSFLVQCSATESKTRKRSPKTQMALEILENDKPVRETVVGKRYTVQLNVPDNYYYEVTSCVAFSGNDTIKLVPLMDSTGCPIEGMMTTFFPVHGTTKIRAELIMFKFNETKDFHIQCTVSQCNTICTKPICDEGKDAKIFGPRILAQNSEEVFAAFRVAVIDEHKSSTTIEYIGCNYGDEPSLYGLVALLILLIILTFLLSALAFYNRPFKCSLQERDAASIHEELIQALVFFNFRQKNSKFNADFRLKNIDYKDLNSKQNCFKLPVTEYCK